jgi:glycosyltransferase involved in cell wall biosynthesis
MEPLSAVIITLNEERNIGRCLDSLLGIADEIVVVDSGSTDATREICLSRGVMFIEHPFEGYIEQKNFARTCATHSLVLSLDADEALSEELKESIRDVKIHRQFDGYTMNRLNYYCGKWIRYGGWYPDKKLRLWYGDAGTWRGTNPHDSFRLFPGKTTGHLKGDILHYSYYSKEDHLRQIERFSTIGAAALYANGVRSNLWKMWLHPLARFVKGYIIKLGFLDGQSGWYIHTRSAYANYLKYQKLRSLWETRKS